MRVMRVSPRSVSLLPGAPEIFTISSNSQRGALRTTAVDCNSCTDTSETCQRTILPIQI